MTQPRVTDHAVLRWLERSADVDVEAVRAAIGGVCARGAAMGAPVVKCGGARFIIVGQTVVTTLGPRQRLSWDGLVKAMGR